MDSRRPYRLWLYRRLSLFLPALGAGLGVAGYFVLHGPLAPWVRLVGLSSALLHCGFVSYLLLQTVRSSDLGRGGAILRRQLRYSRELALGSTATALSLLLLPSLLRNDPDRIPTLCRLRPLVHRTPDGPSAPLPVPEAPEDTSVLIPPPSPPPRLITEEPSSPPPARTAPLAPPAPREAEAAAPPPPSVPKPLEHLLLAWEPRPLELSDQDFTIPREPDPLPPPREEPSRLPLTLRQEEDHRGALWSDADLFKIFLDAVRRLPSELTRAAPDENNPEEWPAFEIRIDGLIFDSHVEGRVAAMSVLVDVPFSKDDSVEVGWLGALLPGVANVPTDGRDGRAWHHVVLEVVHRLSGYTQHATFDFALGAGLTADSFKELDGTYMSATQVHVAPQLSADLNIWHDGAIGLLFHGGQSFPLGIRGSAIGVSDLSATLRVDLSSRLSLHAGYRYMIVRLKEDEVVAAVGSRVLEDAFAGPLVGFDFRF